ncbi:MAG: YbhN family protein [Geminicoccaceae bacterium]
MTPCDMTRAATILDEEHWVIDGAEAKPAARTLWQRLAEIWPWLKFVLGIVLLGLLGWFVDWPGTLRILRHADVGLLLLSAVVIMSGVIVSTIKWQRLVRVSCGPLPFLPLLRAYWIGSFLSNYLPSNVGGDVVRVLVMRPWARVEMLASSVLVERLTGVATLGVISAICLAVRPVDPMKLNLALWLLVAAIGGGLALIFAAGSHLVRGGAALLARLPSLFRRVSTKVDRFGEAVAAFRGAPGELVIAGFWSLVFYGILTLFQFALLRAVGSSITLLDTALVAPLVPLVSLLPVTANGLGLTEGAFVLFYTQMGVPPEQAFAAALLRRLVTIGTSMPGGLFWMSTGDTAGLPRESRG